MARKRLSDETAVSPKAAAPARSASMRNAKHSPARKTAPKSPASVAVSAAAEAAPIAAPSRQEIARLAYAYWEARGRRDGNPNEDWLRAERELAARLFKAGA